MAGKRQPVELVIAKGKKHLTAEEPDAEEPDAEIKAKAPVRIRISARLFQKCLDALETRDYGPHIEEGNSYATADGFQFGRRENGKVDFYLCLRCDQRLYPGRRRSLDGWACPSCGGYLIPMSKLDT